MNTEIVKLISLLERLSSQKIDCSVAERLSEEIVWAHIPELGDVYANLFDYWADEDTREKEVEYKEMQNSELNKLISHLKNKEYAKACQISFLGSSPSL